MNSDYMYVNKSDNLNTVKWTLDGSFVEIGSELSDETLFKMENMEDIDGWILTDEREHWGI